MNGLSNLDEIYREYSIAPDNDLQDSGGQTSKVKVTANRRNCDDTHVDAGVWKFIYFIIIVSCSVKSFQCVVESSERLFKNPHYRIYNLQ